MYQNFESTCTLYNEKIKPARVQDLKTWWKNIKKIVNGKKQQGLVFMDPVTDIPLKLKETADRMNDLFMNLTSEFPEVSMNGPTLELIALAYRKLPLIVSKKN